MDGERLFPSSKKIQIGVTQSLGDLKAELLKRKAEAVNKQKNDATNNNKQTGGTSKWQSIANDLQGKTRTSEKKEKRKVKDQPKDAAAIELDRQLMLSKASLERKAKLYEKRYEQAKAGISKAQTDNSSDDEDWDNENGPNGLVDFREKIRLKIEMPKPRTPSPTPEDLAEEDDYVEFTDSFGRTRKCLKKNLNYYKKMDAEVGEIARETVGPEPAEDDNDSRTWEEVKPVGPVRYQELIQNEIRDHGVGFFRFSENEDERKEQLKMLENIHKETVRQRKLFRIRRRAERTEKRAKQAEEQGVPIESIPEEVSSEEEDSIPESFEELSQRDKEALAMKELMTREWDAGKRDAMGRLVKEPSASGSGRKVTALQASKAIIDERRSEREEEFAPPSFYYDTRPASGFNAFPSSSKKVRQEEQTERSKNIDQIISEKLAMFKKSV